MYKIIAKILVVRLDKLLSTIISLEKFGFLEERKIHDVVGVAQEGIHSIKIKKLSATVPKLDISKAYDHVYWLYLRMLIINISFS